MRVLGECLLNDRLIGKADGAGAGLGSLRTNGDELDRYEIRILVGGNRRVVEELINADRDRWVLLG